MKPVTAVALSGGIDSSTAAWLLLQQGHALIGLHFRTGFEPHLRHGAGPASHAGKIAAALGIPFEVVDLSAPFQQEVIDYFVATYQAGRTPNPCLVCNPAIKFGALWEAARRLGAERLATGHYARVCAGDGIFHLQKGLDRNKDQSYFLARLTQSHLRRACFPLGAMTKDEVRKLAAAHGLLPPAGRESQDICFIKGKGYADFLARQPGFAPVPGPIQDMEGRVIGRHNGLHGFTVGQRRGINCPAARPYYVVHLDRAGNRLIVGSKADLTAASCRVTGIGWIGAPPSGPLALQVRLRYRHRAVEAVLHPEGRECARVVFAAPQSAVTPGQGAVFYQGETVLGGGWIQSEPHRLPAAAEEEGDIPCRDF